MLELLSERRGDASLRGMATFEGGSAEELSNNELIRKFYLGL